VAACGVPFAKMSGRGLGHTGGTLDKLESIPGFRTELSVDAFVAQVADVGMAIVSQSADLAPADGRLYALRDVTATIESIPLIAASIMSKKIAAGADAILLDVKVGRGAFMRTLEDARALAVAMRDLGARARRRVVCELTDMSQPLGLAVGNALEIREVVETLRGGGPPDLTELVLGSAGHLLELSDLGVDVAEGRRRAEQAIGSGAALAAYERWVAAQGGDPDVAALPQAPIRREVRAGASGVVEALDALAVGVASANLGAGRQRKDEPVDHATGIVCRRKRGDAVTAGDVVAEVHARSEAAAAEAVAAVAGAFRVGPGPSEDVPLVLAVID
jgi:pyrimidine-nucleoside phosphorylase